MEIECYFNPVNFNQVNQWDRLPHWSMGNQIETCTQNLDTNLDQIDVAIIGVEEDRNASHVEKGANSNAIRSMLYQLNSIDKNLKIIDLGNLKLGNNVSDTYFALSKSVNILLEKNVRPIILGGTQDITVPVNNSLKGRKSCVVLDSKIDYELEYDLYDSAHFLNGFTESNLKRTSILGYQNYFIDETTKTILEQKGVRCKRVGEIRADIKDTEPTLRDADIVSFDTKCIKNGDYTGNYFPSPNGFSGQEVCQMAWYAGNSNLNNILIISGYTGLNDSNKNDAMLLAQLVWHFAKGVFFAPVDHLENKDLIKYIDIEFESVPFSLSFKKSEHSQRWWVAKIDEQMKKSEYISCTEEDYMKACKNQLSNRISHLTQ